MPGKSQKKLSPLILTGTVVRGDGRGTDIGFPTANLMLTNQTLRPNNGIYACLAQVLPETTIYQAALHVGPRPTISGALPTTEVHLLDFPYRQLYGKQIKVGSLLFIRQIKKYPNLKELSLALAKDIETARKLLKTNHEQ